MTTNQSAAEAGRIAARIREIAAMEADTITDGVILSASEKSRILHIAADRLEELVLEGRHE